MFIALDVFARSWVRRFHTIESLNAIEVFIRYVLKRGTDTTTPLQSVIKLILQLK